MENAADALKMAAAVIIFIIAISSSFSLFGLAKQTADAIFTIRNRQAYLESAELEGVLYTSSNQITSGLLAGFTTNGDRIVDISDVIATIYRYSKEKYGVTIVDGTSGKVIARFDSVTETSYLSGWNLRSTEERDKIASLISENLTNDYVSIRLNGRMLGELYELRDQNNRVIYGENWRANDQTIERKINADISGEKFENVGLTYQGKGLLDKLKGKQIIEVTNEIDQSKYLQYDGHIKCQQSK